MQNSNPMTNEKLYQLCKLYGERARFWRQKFIGLLPEVFKRKLYEKRGFSSIFEFSAKLAGVSEEQVRRVLNLEKNFKDKPDLHKALVNGEVSVNKLARVASISTPENQSFLAEQVKILPQKAIETFVKDEREVVRAHTFGYQLQVGISDTELELSLEVREKLRELKNKNIDINQLILSAIQKREQEIAEEKAKTAFEQEKLTSAQASEKTSRHIPKKIEKLIQKEHGDKCAVPNCPKNSEQIHHEIPFALLKNHNPYFLKPLCKEHHTIAHGINLAYSRHVSG